MRQLRFAVAIAALASCASAQRTDYYRSKQMRKHLKKTFEGIRKASVPEEATHQDTDDDIIDNMFGDDRDKHSETLNQLLDRAREEIMKKEVRESTVRQLKAAADEQFDHAAIRTLYAISLHYIGDKQADEELKKVGELAPDQAEIHFVAARRKEQSSSWRIRDQAAWAYEVGTEIWQGATQFITPDFAEAYYRLGKLYLRDTPAEQAEETNIRLFNDTYKQWTNAIKLNPGHAEAHRGLALLLSHSKDDEKRGEGVKSGIAAVRIRPDQADNHFASAKSIVGPTPNELDVQSIMMAVTAIKTGLEQPYGSTARGRIDAYNNLGHLLEATAMRHPEARDEKSARMIAETNAGLRQEAKDALATAKQLEVDLKKRLKEKKEKKAFMKLMGKRNEEEEAVKRKRKAEEEERLRLEKEKWDAILYDHFELKLGTVFALLLVAVSILLSPGNPEAVQVGKRLRVRAKVAYAKKGEAPGEESDLREVDVINARCLVEPPTLKANGFQVVTSPSAVGEWERTDRGVEAALRAEAEALVQAATGAPLARAFAVTWGGEAEADRTPRCLGTDGAAVQKTLTKLVASGALPSGVRAAAAEGGGGSGGGGSGGGRAAASPSKQRSTGGSGGGCKASASHRVIVCHVYRTRGAPTPMGCLDPASMSVERDCASSALISYNMRHRWLFFSGLSQHEALLVSDYDECHAPPATGAAARRVYRAAMELAGYFKLPQDEAPAEGPRCVEVSVVALIPRTD